MLKINIDNLPKLLAALNEVGELHAPCENKAGKVDFAKWNLEKRPRFTPFIKALPNPPAATCLKPKASSRRRVKTAGNCPKFLIITSTVTEK